MNQSLLNRLVTLEDNKNSLATIHIKKHGNELSISGPTDEDKRLYIPTATGYDFHGDNSFVRLVKGPYGSGKSTMCCTEIVKRTMEMPAWCNGVRRSKWAVVRNTSGELITTTLQTWLHWFSYLGHYNKRQKPVMTYEHIFRDEFGICEIELIFLALDREDDLRKVRSLEVTGVYINEASEVPMGALSHFKGRCNRYPPPNLGIDYWSGIIADTNPPDSDHELYKLFEVDKPNGYRIFNQPPGLISVKKSELDPAIEHIQTNSGFYIANPNADNFKNLKADYYLRLAEGQNEEFIKVFCLGQYGAVIMGKRVYPEYNDDFHSAVEMQYIPGLPVDLFLDYGLTPACLITQHTARGQVRVMKEFIAVDMGLKQLIESIVLPYLNTDLAGFEVRICEGDPAGNARAQSDETTCLDILIGLGFNATSAETNSLLKRLESVKYLLNRNIDGIAALLVSREGAPTLRKGFLGDYHYRRIAVRGEARYQDAPNKNKSSHPHDALQYCAMRFCSAELANRTSTDDDDVMEKMRNPVLRIL